jgi:hypothetical protein
MNGHIASGIRIGAAALAALSIAFGSPAGAAQLRVTNDGTDSPTCGAQSTPCRSIGQAIVNAVDGDTIEVGAGFYGDISGSADFSGPGDEHPQMTGIDDYPGCIVCITKALQIYSLHGAAVTVIAAPAASAYPATVMILHDGVSFGREGGGFTLTGGNANGLVLDQDASRAARTDFGIPLKHDIAVAGNIDVGDGSGFVFKGLNFMDDPCPDPSCQPTAKILFASNQALNNGGSGFNLQIDAYHGGQITLQDNLATGGGTGFLVATGEQNEAGNAISAGSVQLTGNVAVHNGLGFSADAPGPMLANTAVNNQQAGFLVVPGSLFQGNSAIGNAGPGAIVQFSVDGQDTAPLSHFQSFERNNFYGNDRNRPVLALAAANYPGVPAPYDPGPSAHCGVLNLGALAVAVGPVAGGTPPVIQLAATGNYWGSPSGPRPQGSGDTVGGACDQNGGVTVAKPFAKAALAITSWP